MRKIFPAVIFILYSMTGLASGHDSKFDSTITEGIHQIYSLQFSQAESSFRRLIADYPEQPAGRFFLAMIDWWKILVDLDNESHDDIFFQKLEDVIYQCDKILEKEPENVEALFFRGGSIGFRGRLHAIRESWLKAADDGREALPIVERAWRLDSNNVDVKLGFGIYNYYAAVIPEDFPLVKPLMMFFPKGDKNLGINQLMDVAHNGKYAKYESRYFLMTLFSSYEKNAWRAKEWADMLCADFPDNPVFARWKGRISVQLGESQNYFEIFRKVYDKCGNNLFGYNDKAKREATYYLGVYYKERGMADSARLYFSQSVELSERIDKSNPTGFLMNAVLYLGMMNDALGARDRAVECYNRAADLKDYQGSRNLAKKYLETPFKY